MAGKSTGERRRGSHQLCRRKSKAEKRELARGEEEALLSANDRDWYLWLLSCLRLITCFCLFSIVIVRPQRNTLTSYAKQHECFVWMYGSRQRRKETKFSFTKFSCLHIKQGEKRGKNKNKRGKIVFFNFLYLV